VTRIGPKVVFTDIGWHLCAAFARAVTEPLEFSVDPAIHLQESFLDRVLRLMPASGDVVRDALQPCAVGSIELFERTGIPPLAGSQQFGLGTVIRGCKLSDQRQLARSHHSRRFPFRILDGRVAAIVGNL
jgi:hypothetical protein